MKYIYKIVVLILVLFVFSCEPIGSLDDVEINGQVPVDQAYENGDIIESALIGSYASLRKILPMPSYLSAMSISGQESIHSDREDAFLNNTLSIKSGTILRVYSGMYRTLANVNELITRVPKTSNTILSENDKKRVLGEAKFIKALSHFYLLRMYGQFYDINSAYGIILDPAALDQNNRLIPQPRNTVAEVYQSILANLDEVLISGIPTEGDASRATIMAAKALKAKVLLFMNRYSESITLSQDFLNFEFTEDYKDIFAKAHTATEVLFATPTDYSMGNHQGQGFTGGIIPGSETLNALHETEGDTIRRSTTATNVSIQEMTGFKWNFFYDNPPAIMHLRTSEILLIYAEAKTRKTIEEGGTLSDIADAIAQVNKIRSRVNLPEKNPTSLVEFLEIIRLEKLMELYYENGEDWFDLVRYHIAGDISIGSIKPTISNSNQFILPIPFDEIELGEGIIKQNPGY
ncbi:RagB/SusD family nutrient uptake outer membrane protein [Aquimarina aquimarini]|uniref:RagB/SusD family nutrient uptake outer membrane protein n=1 Tax=Aquimarina aquimarini TaxID=1191734 RepID=UPI000D561B73|nr:RagB/SusD family nutrient uptake outer membrane protein [Aquimarina aquimarini]